MIHGYMILKFEPELGYWKPITESDKGFNAWCYSKQTAIDCLASIYTNSKHKEDDRYTIATVSSK